LLKVEGKGKKKKEVTCMAASSVKKGFLKGRQTDRKDLPQRREKKGETLDQKKKRRRREIKS